MVMKGIPRKKRDYTTAVFKAGDNGSIREYRYRDDILASGNGDILLVECDDTVDVLKLPGQSCDEAASEQFRKERAITYACSHPHVIPVRGTGEVELEDGTQPFYVMPKMAGNGRRISGHYSVGYVLGLMVNIGMALDHVHQCGIYHRDVKPGNILLKNEKDGKTSAFLADFGLARTLGSPNPREEVEQKIAHGTPQFMSPERVGNIVEQNAQGSIRSDVYSFGATLYKMIVGEYPFKVLRSDGEFLHPNCWHEPDKIELQVAGQKVPLRLSALVRRTLSKAKARPSSMEDVVEGLLDSQAEYRSN